MQEYFNNEQIIAHVGNHAAKFAQLKNERNWTLGIGFVLAIVAGFGIAYYIKTEEEKKKTSKGFSYTPKVRSNP